MKVEELIRKYLQNNKVMQLATLRNNAPQICTVHYAPDDKLNLYWSSSKFSHHSKDLEQTQKASIGILQDVDLTQCVHAEGNAYKISGKDAVKAHSIYTKRFGPNPERLEKVLSNEDIEDSYYVFKPTKIVLFDGTNFPKNPQQEYKPSS